VNVLLVPAHPGFPGQIPQSRKTVVVVVVVRPMLRRGGKYYMGCIENLILFPMVQKL